MAARTRKAAPKKVVEPLTVSEARIALREAGVEVASRGRLSASLKAQVEEITGRPVA